MSGSSAFANYSNTTQQLENSIGQLAPTSKQITDDKANFEQQFLIGASLMAKGKAAEKFSGLLKNSKRINALKGKGKDAIKKLAQSAQDRAESFSKDLLNKVTGNQIIAPPTLNPSTSPENLDILKNAVKKTRGIRNATRAAKSAADEEFENSTADLAASRVAEQRAADVAEDVVKTATSSQSGAIKSSTIDALRARDAAAANTIAQEQRVASALKNQSDLATKLAQHENNLTGAKNDLQTAKNVSKLDDVEPELESGLSDAEKTIKTAKDLEETEKGLKVAGDLEKVSVETSEADPLGLVIAGVAALVTNIVGRRVKAHETIMSKPIEQTSFSATLGA